MKTVKDQELVKKLLTQADRIREDWNQLISALKESEEAAYSDYSGFFDYLQTQFDLFSRIAKEISSPADFEEVGDTKEEISALFGKFYRLRASWINREAHSDSERNTEWEELLEDEEDEAAEELPAQEETPEAPQEGMQRPGKKKRIIRGVRSPAASPKRVSIEEERAESERRKAEHLNSKLQENHSEFQVCSPSSDTAEKDIATPAQETEKHPHYSYYGKNEHPNESSSEDRPVPAQGQSTGPGYPPGVPILAISAALYSEYKQLWQYKLQNIPTENHTQTPLPVPGSPLNPHNHQSKEAAPKLISGKRPDFAPPKRPKTRGNTSNRTSKKSTDTPVAQTPYRPQSSVKPFSHSVPYHSGQRYTLSKITTRIGGGVTMTMQQAAGSMIHKIDNDSVRFAMKAEYYTYTGKAAVGLLHGIVSKPTGKLQASSKLELSPRQMSGYNAAAVRNQRNLHREIRHLEQQLKTIPKVQKTRTEAEGLARHLKSLKSQRPQVDRAASLSRKVQSFQHQRQLDQEILDHLSVNGRISRRVKPLQELSSSYVRSRTKKITSEFGEDALSRSTRSIQRQIRSITHHGQTIKTQILLLERQGAMLSPSDRKKLISLRQQSAQLGKEIAKLTKLGRSLDDLTYINKQVEQVLTRAGRLHQNMMTAAGFIRTTALRPLYEPGNNTEGLAYGINFLSNTTLYRTAKAGTHLAASLPDRVLSKTAPDLSNRILYNRAARKEKFNRVLKTERKRVKSLVRQTEARILNHVPVTVQQSAANVTAKYQQTRKAISKVSSGVHNRIEKVKAWVSKTKAAQIQKAAAAQAGKVGAFFEKAAAAVKSISVKFVLAIAVSILILSIIPGVVSVISSLCSSVIMAPDANEEGKIDLSPYTSILTAEFKRFNNLRREEQDAVIKEIDETEADFNTRYNNPPKFRLIEPEIYEDTYSEVKVNVDGPATNDRELIAMMAVRFEQDLENPRAKEYLRYMAQRCRVQEAVVDRSYTHSPGCVLIEERIPPKVPPETKPTEPGPVVPPGGGSHVVPGIRSIVKPGGSVDPIPTDPPTPTEPPQPTYERRYVCPGHRELRIDVHVLTLEELYEADDFESGLPDWEGWTEENRDWVQVMLDMDWAELYTGFLHGGMIPVTSEISPEEEKHIWDSLVRIIGGEYGAAGVMGNLFCESRLVSTNLEDQYEPLLGYSNESYTAAVDSGAYTNFIDDAAGYGLAQWTYSTRKAGLLHAAQAQGKSIGDLDIQLDYLGHELNSYGMISRLSTMGSVEEASDYILYNFERPLTPDALRDTRRGISNYFYNKYVLGVNAEGKLTQAQMDVIRVATNSDAYGIAARGGYCQAWAANVYGVAGFPIDGSSCARQSGERYGVSSDFTTVPPGAAVYGYSGSKYGHVGIYVGGGLVYHNVGGVAVDRLEDWVRSYGGFAWGWQAGTDLTALP